MGYLEDVKDVRAKGYLRPLKYTMDRQLVQFLDAVADLGEAMRKRLHFIHTGDMFELWVGRDYQMLAGSDGKPKWKEPSSPELVGDWALEVMVQNAPIFTSLRRLEGAGLAEVSYVGGNHDSYMMKEEMATQLILPRREPICRRLNGDLMVEHGHRFDASNYDNVDGQRLLTGPGLTEWLHLFPTFRKYEWIPRAKEGFTNPSERDGYLLGATLLYLLDRFHLHLKPFGIYVMGHTLFRVCPT